LRFGQLPLLASANLLCGRVVRPIGLEPITFGSGVIGLPYLREHLFERLRERKISAEDLYELKLCRRSTRRHAAARWPVFT